MPHYVFRDRLFSVDLNLDSNPTYNHNENSSLVSRNLPWSLFSDDAENQPQCHRQNILLWKDVLMVAIAVFLFNAVYFGLIFNSLAFHQTQLVLTTNILLFSAQIMSAMFLSNSICRHLGCKSTMILSCSTSVIFASAQFYPNFPTFIICSLIFGSGAIVLKMTSSIYGNLLCRAFAENIPQDVLMPNIIRSLSVYVFVTINLVSIAGGILGVVLPTLILPLSSNYTLQNNSDKCASNYCTQLDHQQLTSDTTILFSLYVVLGGLGALFLFAFLDNKKDSEEMFLNQNLSGYQQWTVVISEMKFNNVRLPLATVISGLIWSYSLADFILAFILCSTGAESVSIFNTVTIFSYVLTILLTTPILRNTRCNLLMIITNIFCGIVLLCQIFWKPNPQSTTLFYFIQVFMGIINGLFYTLNHIEWGNVKINDDVCYSTYTSLFSLGCVLGLAWSNQMCVSFKISISIGFVILSTLLYVIAFVNQNSENSPQIT